MIFSVETNSASQTKRVAKKLARLLRVGDVLLLSAQLGAGKTTFVQGLAQGLGIKEELSSPTFVLVQSLSGRLMLHHMDFYRLSKKDVLAVGLSDYFSEGGEIDPGVVAIEWPERGPNIYPKNHLRITLRIKANTKARESPFEARGAGLLPLCTLLRATKG